MEEALGPSVSFQHDPSRSGSQIGFLSLNDEAAEAGKASHVTRKRSLARPERERIGPGHRQWHYHNRVAQLEEEKESGAVGFYSGRGALRRGKSILERDQSVEVHESGLSLFKRKTTVRRKRRSRQPTGSASASHPAARHGCLGDYAPGPKGPWMLFCYFLTCWIPISAMTGCGLRTREQQRAWREKLGLVFLILLLMAFVGFITFGFTQAVCDAGGNTFHGGAIGNGSIGASSVVINGWDYDFSSFSHPAVGGFNGSQNPLYVGNWNLGGNDASFMFQKVNQNCRGIITKAPNSGITSTGDVLQWYFPCNVRSQYGTTSPNITAYGSSTTCHTPTNARSGLNSLKPQGPVYFTWSDVRNRSRNLAVFESHVLDLELLSWLSASQVHYPSLFDIMKIPGSVYGNKDITMTLYRMNQRPLGRCLQDVISVGFIDTASIGCVASKVVLYASLITIIGVVALRFALAVFYQWFFAWKVGNFPAETAEERKTRAAEIEAWSDGIYLPAPNRYRPDVGKNGVLKKPWKSFLPAQSRFSMAVPQRYSTAPVDGRPRTLSLNSPSTPTLSSPLPFQSHRVVPQPPPGYEPFNFALAHTICLVTAYSESEEGMRTTLDSLATTDYPNSHKVILIIADGMVKGAGNELTTPEICLSMMKETQTWSDVPAHSYVAIADGHKRHNMAKVFSGFYKYDDVTCERSKQQRVPIVLIAKCGNPLEAGDSKPGNRGKRDSQMVLMSFLEKVMFDERMTTLEYEFFNALWGVTGVSPDKYELVLCVDADTKAFPDSLSRMVACMVHDVSIMGLCGETKIANKADSWVTMIQVFEYYISHHLTKAFESLFGIVSCLPGCFSMYRIKAPKNDQSGYWIPILANPDIIEHYSENVVDTLHKKNLLLLGEDRYLTTLLLKTFPQRKNIFCQQAICKTIVPDTFSVLLSQRRRWINSTVHNLFELVLVRESCGTFCFSMQFMVAVELLGTLVLPAAISFTLYLIISSIVPGGSNNTLSLVLLALVLGLPGLLIVITSTKVAYVGWMLIYLLSLPIWNGILPAYAYWHFDDFSWGQTRKIEGEATHTGDKEGEFDSSHIVMKRWSEFERDKAVREGRVQANRRSFASHTSRSSAGFDGGFREGFNTANLYRDNIGLIRVPAPLSVPVTPLSSSRQLTPRSSSLGSDDRYDSPPPSSLLPLYATSSVSSRLPSRSRLPDSPVPQSSFDLNPFRDSSPDTEAVDMYLNDAVPPRRSRFQPVQLVDHGPVPINQ